jgi:hypothetical protein
VVTVAGALAGLAAYIYLLGGVVVWLGVTSAELPGDVGVAASDSRHLLSIGSRVVVFEALLLIGVCSIVAPLVVFTTSRRRSPPGRSSSVWRRGDRTDRPPRSFADVIAAWRDLISVLGMIGPALALLLITLGLSGLDWRAGPFLAAVGSVLAPIGWDWSLGLVIGIFGVLIGAIAIGWMIGRPPASERTEKHESPASLQAMAGALLFVNVVVAVGVVPLLQGTVLLAGTVLIYLGPFVNWPESWAFRRLVGELMRSSGVWLGVTLATAVALAWVATPPIGFSRAKAFLTDGSTVGPGAYIDRNGDGLYVGFCDKSAHGYRTWIRFVPDDEIREVVLSSGLYQFDPHGRPSIAQVALAGVENRTVGAATGSAPLNGSLRNSAGHLCGSER